MKKASWDVTILATVKKTVTVKAKTEQEAIELAHGEFSVLCDNDQEKYTQETVEVKKH